MPRRKSQDAAPEYFTTFQVAKMLHVSPPTVVNWVNSGLLTAHRTPGGHRRISKADILAFAKSNDFPAPSFASPTPTQIPLLPPSAPPPEPAPRAVAPPEPPPLPVLKRILVVDDEQEFCRVVQEYLSEVGGYDVEVAFSGFAAGLTVARFHPELILLDINLAQPHQVAMDGFQLLKILQDDPETRAIPVIACTGVPDPRIEAQVRRGTLYAFLEKPFQLAQLAQLVGEALAVSAGPRPASAASGPAVSAAPIPAASATPVAAAGNGRSSYAQPVPLTASGPRV
ncbi:MAG: response regulator [Pseudomonadota bacterium]|nr:response regulator [Pseudomonadota bacterium]